MCRVAGQPGPAWLMQEDQGENDDDRFARLEKLIVRATKKKDKARSVWAMDFMGHQSEKTPG